MANQAAIHKRNLESAILFMQSEHANTLKGLHEEIKNLQKKCSDLTFQLNMQGLGVDIEGSSGTRFNDLETQIEQQNKVNKDLESEIQQKDKRIKDIEQLVKKQKMKNFEEMRSKNQEIDQLKADLEAKSNQVAYLTTELHKHKRLSLENATTGAFIADAKKLPAPPKEQPNHLRRSHRLRQSKPSVDPEELERHPVRFHSGHSSGTSRSTSPVEMVKPFLRKGEEAAAKIDVMKERQPLPPIRAHTGIESHRQQVYLQQVLPSSAHNPVKSKKTQEVQVLAVDQVSNSKSDSKWAHTHSTDYN